MIDPGKGKGTKKKVAPSDYENRPRHPQRGDPPTKKFAAEFLEKSTIVVSCGVLNFEEGAWSSLKTTGIKDKFCNNSKLVPAGCLSDTKLMAQFVDSFKKNYPELVEGRRILVIDCTAFAHDPETEGKGLREHKASHHETMASLLNARNWQEVNAPLEEIDFEGDNLVICACKVGRHRAVANKESILPAMAAILYANDKSRVGSIDLQSLTHWKTICSSMCTQCKINPLT